MDERSPELPRAVRAPGASDNPRGQSGSTGLPAAPGERHDLTSNDEYGAYGAQHRRSAANASGTAAAIRGMQDPGLRDDGAGMVPVLGIRRGVGDDGLRRGLIKDLANRRR